jgi:hypothetical protein
MPAEADREPAVGGRGDDAATTRRAAPLHRPHPSV